MFKIDQTDSNKNAYTYRNQSYLSNFSLSDIQQYNGMPFYIDHSLLMYVTHVYIPFSKQNESICLEHIKQLNALIFPLKNTRKILLFQKLFGVRKILIHSLTIIHHK